MLNSFAFRTNLSEEDIDGSPLDMVFVLISAVPNMLSPLAYLWFYRGIGVTVSTFCTDFSNGLPQVVPTGMTVLKVGIMIINFILFRRSKHFI